MSIQQERFLAIADAIRSKEGSSDAIPAKDFAERIANLPDPGPAAVSYGRDTIGVSTSHLKNGVISFSAGKKYAAIVIIPALKFLTPCVALLQQDGTYLSNYTASSGLHDPEPDILTVTGSEGAYQYAWAVDPDNLGLDYVGSSLACIYVQ